MRVMRLLQYPSHHFTNDKVALCFCFSPGLEYSSGFFVHQIMYLTVCVQLLWLFSQGGAVLLMNGREGAGIWVGRAAKLNESLGPLMHTSMNVSVCILRFIFASRRASAHARRGHFCLIIDCYGLVACRLLRPLFCTINAHDKLSTLR